MVPLSFFLFLSFNSINLSCLGQFWVIADTWEGFKAVYGRYPDDHSWLTLDDDQSTLVMRDPAGRKIQTVEYDDSRPWSGMCSC